MARYIDADALMKKLNKDPIGQTIVQRYNIDGFIEAFPTADVVEVKHGNWVGIDDDPCETFECDRCGFVLDDWVQGALYNFCPNCGAKMDGKETEDVDKTS